MSEKAKAGYTAEKMKFNMRLEAQKNAPASKKALIMLPALMAMLYAGTVLAFLSYHIMKPEW